MDGPGTLELLCLVIGPHSPVMFLLPKAQAADGERLAGFGAAGLIANCLTR